MPTIVYPSTIDYLWLYQRPQQLLKEISKLGYKVIYYNNEVYFKQKNSIMELYPNFLLCKSDIPIKYLKVDEPVISWISYPPHIKLVNKFSEDFLVFDAIDDASDEFADWAKNLDEISSKANLIFTTAEKLYNYHKSNHKNVHMCPNGADYEHFNKAKEIFAPKPKDLPNSKPIVGYFGAVAPWIDWNLIKYLSLTNKNINFVIIGPRYGVNTRIVRAKNIYYLGRKEYQKLPLYLQYFDVCILPFKISSMIEGCNPIKMYEYLSAGKPTVSTNMPEVASIKEVYTAKNNREFNLYIHKALSEKNDYEKINNRMQFAKRNSWEHRAHIVVNVLDNMINQKNKKSFNFFSKLLFK